ncbi:DMT family transporter [Paenibacillus whitsoniae]|uniref:DMT family transporter n=1 Tax=Paenibacillus whitsoniae TaxID=2496558 RepID=UPI0019D04C0A|nr:DMT family transporter [Paenibacillus whitsoniae]
MERQTKVVPWKFAVLLILTTFVMGIAFPVGKMGLAYAPPFFLMGIRYVMAGGLLAIFAGRRPRPKGKMPWLQVAVIGLCQTAGVMGFCYYSMHWITASESSIITFMSPLLVIVLGAVLLRNQYRARQWGGVIIGFIGVIATLGFQLRLQGGIVLGLAGALCFAAATLLIKRWGAGLDAIVLAAYQMLFGGGILLLLSGMTERPAMVLTPGSIGILLVLVILCSIVQFSAWFYLLGQGDPAKTSSFLFLVPFFGVLSSWLLLGEQIRWYVGVGGALIGIGIYLVNGGGQRVKAKEAARVREGAVI